MMGYKDGIPQDLNLRVDPFPRIHKLRPTIPNPNNYISSPNRNNHIIRNPRHHHLGNKGVEDEVMVSSRWNPAPEQVTALEELYRCGTRTPSAEQIQHITAQLRRYGKIEGKNVFYWFQNHKARERQKRRRQLHVTDRVHQLDDTSIASTDKGFEDDEEEKSYKRAPLINNKEVDHAVERADIPKKSDMMTSRSSSCSSCTSCFQFPSQQHNYNHPLCQQHLIFLSQLHQSATCPTQQLNVTPSSSLPNDDDKVTCSSQLLSRTHSPENVKGQGGGTTVAVTLQLFPVLEQGNNDDSDIKKIRPSSAENIISCMVSDDYDVDFVPYYQFL